MERPTISAESRVMLRKEFSGITRIARELDEELYPGVAAQFHYSTKSYAQLLKTRSQH